MLHAEEMKQGASVLPSTSNAQGAFDIVTACDGVHPGFRVRKLVTWLPDKTLGRVALGALLVQTTTTVDRKQHLCACRGQMTSRGRMDSFRKPDG